MTPTSTRQKLSGDVVVVCHWHRDRAGALWEVELRLRPERLDALAARAVLRALAGKTRPARAANGGLEVRVTRQAK